MQTSYVRTILGHVSTGNIKEKGLKDSPPKFEVSLLGLENRNFDLFQFSN